MLLGEHHLIDNRIRSRSRIDTLSLVTSTVVCLLLLGHRALFFGTALFLEFIEVFLSM
jgi:hypothetical protein